MWFLKIYNYHLPPIGRNKVISNKLENDKKSLYFSTFKFSFSFEINSEITNICQKIINNFKIKGYNNVQIKKIKSKKINAWI